MPRPPGDSPHNIHSNGLVLNQPDAPEFWVPLNHSLVGNLDVVWKDKEEWNNV